MDKTLADTLTAWRRHLHAHPEVTLGEKETSAFVCAKLAELGVPFVAGIGGHGVVATLTRGQSNRAVGLRADMDALPIAETTGLPHASQNPGVMHACGHDGHTTSLLGAAALLARDPSWAGTVHLIFQPAEEGGGGAKSMIADGLFQRFPMERIFGYHNWPGLDAGTVMVHDGPSMAAGARIFITVTGHAGHAAMPHLTRDPLVAAAHLLIALQSIVARNVNPMDSAVVTIGVMNAGSAANQIPETVEMRGTMRTMKQEVSELVEARIREISSGIAQTFGVQIDVEIRHGVVVTVNSPAEAELAVAAAGEAGFPVRRDLSPTMGGEDFSWFLRERPGAYAWIGNGLAKPGKELHNPGYDFNDAILPVAATWLAGVAKKSLAA
jgi:amidohydrolase